MLNAPIFHGYTALDLAIVGLAAFAMPVMSILTGRKLARAPGAHGLLPRYILIISRGVLFIVLVAGAWWMQDRRFSALGLAPHLSLWDYAGFALALLIGVVMVAQGMSLASAPVEKVERAMKAIRSIKITPNTPEEFALFILMSLSAGVWEELVYRGFLVWFLVPLTGVVGAIVISALIFGLAHIYQGIRGFVASTVLGRIFAALYLFTASLWWLMVVHAAIDMAGGFNTVQIKRAAARHALA